MINGFQSLVDGEASCSDVDYNSLSNHAENYGITERNFEEVIMGWTDQDPSDQHKQDCHLPTPEHLGSCRVSVAAQNESELTVNALEFPSNSGRCVKNDVVCYGMVSA